MLQIIPTTGPHNQFYVDFETVRKLLILNRVKYDPDYGPNGLVYRPVGNVDAETVRAWLI